MRVHELAKEFGMSSKELLDKLQELKIPAKNHASTLVDAYVDKIRKELGPEIAERQAAMEEERKKQEAIEAAKKAEEDAKRKAEAEARAKAEAEERAKREAAEAEAAAQQAAIDKANAEAAAKAAAEAAAQEAAAAEERAKRDAEAAARLEKEEEDRYRRMAQEAEKLQKDKVIEEAKAAVAAAQVESGGKRKKKKDKRRAQDEAAAEAQGTNAEAEEVSGDVVVVTEGVTVGELADALEINPNEIIKRLMMLGSMITVNQPMPNDIVDLIADDLGRQVRIQSPEEETMLCVFDDDEADLEPRAPVVTVMGHVDHGKTSLLDAIRETGVAATEAGGITQHIGASVVEKNGRKITFIDTPGHEAFTAMRARGANVTDVVVLVVAADDGVMPQTVEAINHAQAAGAPIIVAVNKIDKDGANPDRVRTELSEHGIQPEEWGGTNIFVEVSAKKRINIDELLEMILLQADVLELKANPNACASGVVIEANLDKGRGPVATVLVRRGTLKVGDPLVAGTAFGRVRALVDPKGATVVTAGPADPVEILGLSSVPSAGDEFMVFEDERDARNLAEERALKQRLRAQDVKKHVTLDNLFDAIAEGELKDLNLVVKADVQGSIEALKDALDKMDQTEVRINVIHSGVGAIAESDIMLADASDAIVIGFNVRPQPQARDLAEREKVDVRLYKVIYQAIEEINAARVGMLSPDVVEQDTARVEVRELFKVPKMGTIAGSYVQEGEISRDDQVRVVRDGTVVWDGKIGSLRRFKEDVKSVKQGYECGVGIENFQDLKEGDIIEAYKTVEVAREA